MFRLRHVSACCAAWAVLATTVACGGSSSSSSSAGAQAGDLAERIGSNLERVLDPNDPVRAILVYVDGRAVYKRYFEASPSDYRDVASVTKSVISTLVGVAVGEGQIASVDETLGQLLPAYARSMSPRVAAITLRQVLTMTAGFVGEDDSGPLGFTDAKDPVRTILNSTVVAPGREFIYSDAGAQLVSAILETATGMSVLDYARSRLFDPLGIRTRPAAEPLMIPSNVDAYYQADFAWPVDRQGIQLAWGGLKLRPVDMADLGLLYMNNGRWEGKQVVSADWVEQATHAQVKNTGPGAYGYFWWVSREVNGESAFVAYGYGGQEIEVVPDLGLVLVISTDFDMREYGEGITSGQASAITTAVYGAVSGL
jgi:CubicO group peptidase (beta-lactamase class C family)